MAASKSQHLEVQSRRQWRAWLQKNHDSVWVIWVVLHKRHAAKNSLSYDDLIEEALCFGWVDSIVKRLDDDRYARKFTPRKPDSKWSTINRKRYADLRARGLLAEPGINRAPTNRSGDAPRPSVVALPPYVEQPLRANGRAWDNFQKLAPSYRRNYIAWIDSAKRGRRNKNGSTKPSFSWPRARSWDSSDSLRPRFVIRLSSDIVARTGGRVKSAACIRRSTRASTIASASLSSRRTCSDKDPS
jgi:uncharacterized protein YdeI (YjbR/CyaY-like superfamily)